MRIKIWVVLNLAIICESIKNKPGGRVSRKNGLQVVNPLMSPYSIPAYGLYNPYSIYGYNPYVSAQLMGMPYLPTQPFLNPWFLNMVNPLFNQQDQPDQVSYRHLNADQITKIRA